MQPFSPRQTVRRECPVRLPSLPPGPTLCSDLAHLGSCSFVLLYFAKAHSLREEKVAACLFVCLHSINGSMVTNPGARPAALEPAAGTQDENQEFCTTKKFNTHTACCFSIPPQEKHISLVRLDPGTHLTLRTPCAHTFCPSSFLLPFL